MGVGSSKRQVRENFAKAEKTSGGVNPLTPPPLIRQVIINKNIVD